MQKYAKICLLKIYQLLLNFNQKHLYRCLKRRLKKKQNMQLNASNKQIAVKKRLKRERFM